MTNLIARIESAGCVMTEGTDMTNIENVARANCRGSWALGTACGKCPRCEATRPAIAAMTELEQVARAAKARGISHRNNAALLAFMADIAPFYGHPPVPQWQGIESAPDLERVIVAGWNPHSGNVRGYWWYGEDVVSNGRAIEHPRATLWRPFNNPDFPTPPTTGGSDAE